MRMTFGPDDGTAFERAKDALLGEFEGWLATVRDPAVDVDEAPADAAIALDWKHGYADGDLGRWDVSDVAEFLLEWCPRKLSVPQQECHSLPGSFAAFLRFLEATNRLDRRSTPLATLRAAIEQLAPDYVAAMGDPSKFGMAKSLFTAASADGVDFSDADATNQWIAEFNARPEEERRRLLPQPDRTPERLSLPPVALPEDDAARASAAAAPILTMFRAFAGFVGDGRKLTTKGRLTLADARALVDLLGTGDRMDEKIGDRVFHTVSSDDLPRLRLVFAWARKAGIVRVAHGRVIATKKMQALDRDPASMFEPCARALLQLGPLGAQRYVDRVGSWTQVTEFLDYVTPSLLLVPYVAQRPVPLEALVESATAAVGNAFTFHSAVSELVVASHVSAGVMDIVDALALAGVLTRSGTEAPEFPGYRSTGGTVELTPAGIGLARDLLVEAGYDAPTAGEYADLPAAELLRVAGDIDPTVAWGEFEAWRRRRTPDEAARDLAAAVGEVDPALRPIAFAVLAAIGADAAPHVERLAAEPATRGFAQCWLVDQDLAPLNTLFDPTDLPAFVDALAHYAAGDDLERLAETLALAGGPDEQRAVISRLWRVDSPYTGPVLDEIGAAHPVKAVAKAARKAALQHRSWLAGQQR